MTEFPAISACAIIVAAGSGSRAGALPKQFQMLAGKPVLVWAVEALCRHKSVSDVVVVHSPNHEEEMRALLARFPIIFACGGTTRTESVRAGLAALDERSPDFVLIHDAARPGIEESDIDRLLVAASLCDGAAPALPVADSLKRVDDAGFILSEMDRSGIQRVQTPQCFRLDKIRAAYDALQPGQETTDDLSVAAAGGCRLQLIPGAERLDKITFANDFDRLERLLSNTIIRTGSGFDVHAFGPGDHVWLCGVQIPYHAGLIGHSDADAPWHALTDALLGALAEGDIGDHFPPSDEKWGGMSSEYFLRFAAERVTARGGAIINVDMTIMCEAPKVKPHREAMRVRTAEVLGIDIGAVSVKATTTEGLGFLGRGEGLAAQAIVSIKF